MTLAELYRRLDDLKAPSWQPGAPFVDAPGVLEGVLGLLEAYDPTFAEAARGLRDLDEKDLQAALASLFAGEAGPWSEAEAFALLATLRAYTRQLSQPVEGEGARCPVCGNAADVAYLDEDGFRHLVCAVCDSEWKVERIGCPYCGEKDPKKIHYYPYDPHYRLYRCETCDATLPAVDLREAGSLDLPALRAAGVEMRYLLETGRVEG